MSSGRLFGEILFNIDAEAPRSLSCGKRCVVPVQYNVSMLVQEPVGSVRRYSVDGDVRIAVISNPAAVGILIFRP